MPSGDSPSPSFRPISHSMPAPRTKPMICWPMRWSRTGLDRKVVRRRRGLDGLNAIVTRIAAAPPLFRAPIVLPVSRHGLVAAALVRVVWQSKSLVFYWYSDWYSLAWLASASTAGRR